MKTDDLIGLLASDAAPVAPRTGERRLALALAVGAALALVWVQLAYGVRADLADLMWTPAFVLKQAMPLAVAVCAVVVVFRLAHPGAAVKSWRWGLVVPVLLVWLLATAELWQTPAAARVDLVLGQTWRVCAINIVATAVPVGAAVFWALRGLAPTRPALTGAAAGWLAGAVGGSAYALHCSEMSTSFLAVWYVLGMAVCAALGAWAGRRWLRW